jgi:thioredoxin reductase (NADPH)
MNDKVYPIAVIGGGAAGTQAALRSVLNNDETVFFPGTPKNKKGSRDFWVKKVENMPAHLDYKKGIVEPNKETYKWIEESDFKDNFHHKLKVGITEIKKETDIFLLTGSDGETYQARFVILCTGVMDVQPHIQESIKDILPYANFQTADYCLRCDGHHVLGKKLSVIGNNSGAVWVGAMLYERYNCPSVTILTNGKPAEFDEGTSNLIKAYDFKVFTQEITEVLGVKREGKLEGFKLVDETEVKTELCFIALGMIVYNELAKSLSADLDERGFVVTDDNGLTNIGGLYVAGDLRANTRKQIYTAWDGAVSSSDAINSILRRERRTKALESI